ncbi:MAG: hypothetical protein QM811_09350 [Pirellulales bacterium]
MPEPGTLKRLLTLRSGDQAVIAGLVLVGTLVLGWWYVYGMTGGRDWVDIDAAETLSNRIVVNVNTATEAELMLLPEIGVGTSAKILTAPRRAGRFARRRISRIGSKESA